MRFDEVELQSVPFPDVVEGPLAQRLAGDDLEISDSAPLFRRFLAVLTDLSLFAALALALSALLPLHRNWSHVAALAGFVLMTSYYYFVGAWLLWGKTIGGAIFEVRVVPTEDPAMSLSAASARWIGVCASVALGGLGFAVAVLPGRRSLPDRMSDTRCISAA